MQQDPASRGIFGEHQADWAFARRVLIAIGLIALAYFLWATTQVWFLVFGSVLLAVILSAFADLIHRYTRASRRWSLAIAVTLAFAATVAFLAMFGTQLAGQLSTVFDQLPQAVDSLGERLGIPNATEQVEQAIRGSSGTSSGSAVMSRVAGLGYSVIGAITDVLLVAVAGIYLAAEPRLYREGLAKLFPAEHHKRIVDAMTTAGNALRLWFGGQLADMVLVGVLTGLGFWWVGLSAPIALGLIAGVTNFIPFIGPIIGSIPAVVFAFGQDMNTVYWVIGIVLAVQQLESNVFLPIVQKRAVSLPPALALFAIVVFGLIGGFVGIFLAVPLTVAIYVLVKKLYVRETLGEKTKVPGEEKSEAAQEIERRTGEPVTTHPPNG